MDTLAHTIDTTPIIDHHAHNLLLPHERNARPLLALTTEASDGALRHTPSTVSHLRAVQQLAALLGCAPDWDSVQAALAEKRDAPDHAWAKRCFEGLETVLVDDGLDEHSVHPWQWHHRLTRAPCKRIMRLEKLAETILKTDIRSRLREGSFPEYGALLRAWESRFIAAIEDALEDPDVVGFKSVICYRTGLAVPAASPDPASLDVAFARLLSSGSNRLKDVDLSPRFVHLAAKLISESTSVRKPLQFHTGLGDNDITLSFASPSHLQPFIIAYPKVPIVLLHASYPFTKEAGYLASVYENVYLDIGEVFPMVSQDGQENVIRESLELCPSEKLCWSTDGHWFPETYLLAIIQVREAMKQVLGQNIARKSLELSQAIKIVEDVFFNTANRLYHLGLNLTPLEKPKKAIESREGRKILNLDRLANFLLQHPSVKFIRLQWLDYTATLRVRAIPIKVALNIFNNQKSIGITKAVVGLLQQDQSISGVSPVGEYELIPCFESLRLGDRPGYAIVQGEFRESDGSDAVLCPRTVLRHVVERGLANGLSFKIGFELEVVFMTAEIAEGSHVYGSRPIFHGHSWSNASGFRNPQMMDVVEEIVSLLEKAQIELLQFHPESAPGQLEFVTGPLPPLESVDALLETRNIIYGVAEKYGLKATFVPKPYPSACGTGAHVHMSLEPETPYASFYAGILQHLRAIAAFTYSNRSSYDRVLDSVWSGGRYVAWGTQNREAPLRKITGSHWELKCMDGLANPYFAMAAILGAGLQGVLDGASLTMKDCQEDPALMDKAVRKEHGVTQMMPKDLEEAMRCLDEDVRLRHIVGSAFVDHYLKVKKGEMDMLDGMSEEEQRQFLLERY